MIEVQISAADKAQLFKERFTHPHPRVMKKMEALYLKSCGLPNNLICSILQIDGNTLRAYIKEYLSGGIDQLKVINFNRPQSDLQAFADSIENYFRANPPKSICEAAAKIKELTGIERKETQVRKFLKGMGFRHLKVGEVPAKALTEEKKTNSAGFWKKS
jgi:transposase